MEGKFFIEGQMTFRNTKKMAGLPVIILLPLDNTLPFMFLLVTMSVNNL